MKKTYKLLLVCVGILVFLTVIVTAYGYSVLRRSLPPGQGAFELPGLQSTVEVILDENGVPHIYGSSDEDLVRVLGYMHARDRLWQMDLTRRAASGRLAELFGERAYDIDVFQKVIGLERTAEKIVKNLDKDTLGLLKAYSEGVNQYIIGDAPEYPSVEFRVLGYQMKPWTPTDSLTVSRMTGWQLSRNWNTEALRSAIAAERGEEAMWDILPKHTGPGPYIIPPQEKKYGKSGRREEPSREKHARFRNIESEDWPALLDISHSLRKMTGRVTSTAASSNSWVVSPSKTASGGAILSNDPHLDLMMPGVWHEAHLHGDELDVAGVSFPGTPVIVLGHTPYVAWGATTTMADTQDLYIIITDETHPGKYLYDGNWRPFEIIEETVKVKTSTGMEERKVEIRSTVHGPVINDHVEMPEGLPPVALRWTGHEISDEVKALMGMAKARDANEFLKALEGLKAPIQNWVYADREGNIGYIAGGLLPKRKKGEGLMPVPGDDPDYAWDGFVPFDELPQLTNPSSGYIATANNKVAPEEDYPYIVSYEYTPPYRAMRIVEVLEEAEDVTAGEMTELQMDTKFLHGKRLAPCFIEAYEKTKSGDQSDERLGQLVDILREWDYSTPADSVATAFFNEAYRQAFKLTYKDEVSDSIWKVIREERTAYNGFDNGIENDFALFDDRRTGDRVEGRDEILRKAMVEAVGVLEEQFGEDVKDWQWGKMHTVLFDHPFGGQHALLRKIFSAGPYSLPGSRDTVNNGYFRWWNNPYEVYEGPGMRHVVDYGDFSSARMTIVPGQSAHRLSEHYSDQVEDWVNGGYHSMPMEREKVEAREEGRLEFVPEK